MAPGFDDGWPLYVPVAERRKKAAREMEKLRKKGHLVAPVVLEGRTIARTFWGKAWCDNLESYRDYDSRLPRGRSYVRNGAVIDLQILPLEIRAMVSGSSIYKVTVTLQALAPILWRSICEDCAGAIDSVVELLQGRFSKGVMERICRQDQGLFPKPSDIRFSCTCPDGALMCKHVAAVLYGVGARLDERPEVLFQLRAVDENDLVSGLDTALPLSTRLPMVGNVLETDDLSSLFGLEMDGGGGAMAADDAGPAAPDRVDRTGRRRRGTKAVGRKITPGGRLAPADQKADTSIAQPCAGSKAPATRQASGTRSAGNATHSDKPVAQAPPLEASTIRRASGRGQSSGAVTGKEKRTLLKPKIELTPDGFVKWWK
jgi:hypothetical protein